jgi:hypothetical protein
MNLHEKNELVVPKNNGPTLCDHHPNSGREAAGLTFLFIPQNISLQLTRTRSSSFTPIFNLSFLKKLTSVFLEL